MIWLSIVCAVLSVIIVALCVKIAMIKADVKSITAEFAQKLESDTNTLITVFSNDKTIRKLASEINSSLKELRKQKLRFERGDNELKNAVTSISHDLRTPLTAISGYLELLNGESKSETAERYISVIKNRTEALKSLSDQLFRYSVITSPDYSEEKRELSVGAVLEESLVGYYAALHQRGIEPQIVIPDKTINRTLNRAALSRIFSNLIANAIKYSDGDLYVELTENGNLTFSNSAKQLNEVQVNRLFDRFYTVESARKSTGLGLSIAKTLVEQMNGKIQADYKNGNLIIQIELPEA